LRVETLYGGASANQTRAPRLANLQKCPLGGHGKARRTVITCILRTAEELCHWWKNGGVKTRINFHLSLKIKNTVKHFSSFSTK